MEKFINLFLKLLLQKIIFEIIYTKSLQTSALKEITSTKTIRTENIVPCSQENPR